MSAKTPKSTRLSEGILSIRVGAKRLRKINEMAASQGSKRSVSVRNLLDQGLDRELLTRRLEAGVL